MKIILRWKGEAPDRNYILSAAEPIHVMIIQLSLGLMVLFPPWIRRPSFSLKALGHEEGRRWGGGNQRRLSKNWSGCFGAWDKEQVFLEGLTAEVTDHDFVAVWRVFFFFFFPGSDPKSERGSNKMGTESVNRSSEFAERWKEWQWNGWVEVSANTLVISLKVADVKHWLK